MHHPLLVAGLGFALERAALRGRYGGAGDGGEGARLASKLDALKRRAALLLRYG